MTTHGHEHERMALIALSCLVEPGDRELGILVRRVGAVEAFDRIRTGTVSERLTESVAARLAADGPQPHPRPLAEAALERAERIGARILTGESDEWPHCLSDLTRISRDAGAGGALDRDTDPPLALWIRGEAHLGDTLSRSVAVVGARASTPYGNHVAGELCFGLASRGWTVVSGGAFGIDAAAHRAALAAGTPTVAVLACGPDRPYPVSHTSLFERIAEEGLVITEWPPGAAPHRYRFLVRNRVIAAATRGTVLVEAGIRSGARHTLGRARLLGRAAMVVPGPVGSAMSVGCHEELRRIGTRLVADPAQVVEEVGRIGDDLAPLQRGNPRPHDALDPMSARVLDAVLPRRRRTAEQVAAAAGISARDARRSLPLLVSARLVISDDAGYRLAPPTDLGDRIVDRATSQA